jgi:hypothetical protein
MPCLLTLKAPGRRFAGAKIAIIFVAPNAQNIASFKMGFTFIAQSNGFAPGQNVILKAFKKSDVVWLHGIIP